MQIISNICSSVVALELIAAPVLLVIWIIRKIRKKPKWKWFKWFWISFAAVVAVGVITSPSTWDKQDKPATINSSNEVVENTEPDSMQNGSGKSETTSEQENENEEDTVGTATFEEIYKAYQENELVADDLYQYNRYQVTAEINSMTNGGLFNLTGGATLTLKKRVDNTIVFFYAEFEKEQEENLKAVKVGDTITFVGECMSAGSWVDCELIVE